MPERSLADNEGFWVILLGKRYERIPESDRNLERLCSEFYVGRKNIIRSEYSTKEDFIEEIQSLDEDEAKQDLQTIWAKKKWEEKSKGKNLELEGDFSDELERLREDGKVIQELEEDYYLIWPSQSRARVLSGEDDIYGQLQEEAHPIIVKKDEDNIEVRGGKRRVDRFSKEVSKSEEVQEVEPEQSDESIIDDLSILFEKELDTLKLTEIRFLRTYLPDNSSVGLKNNKGILRDLNDENVRQEIVDYQSLSELDFFKFDHVKTGKAVKVNVDHTDEGFQFEVDDSYLPEHEKDSIREHLAEQLGIEFDKIYAYDAQHDEEYIVHKILAGNPETYHRYYGELDEGDQEFLDRFLNVSQDTEYVCYRCQTEHEEEMEECEECGNDSLREEEVTNLTVDDGEVHDAIFERLQEIESDEYSYDSYTLRNLEFEEAEISGNDFVRSTFWLEDSSDETIDSHRYEYYIYGLGNGRLPHRVNQYLLNTILIVYGNSRFKDKNEFGVIDLYTLMQQDDIGEMVVNAILKSKQLLPERIHGRAVDAESTLTDLSRAVSNNHLEDWVEEEGYSSKNFEKDVFYLLKLMFNFTERWGREGLRESDGCLIIPNEGGSYDVFSYDPKLTSDPKGYDLNARERDKAAYYIITESNNEKIQNLADGSTVDGHIFISDNFRETQFENVTDQVLEWFDLIEGDESGQQLDVPIIFLPLETVLDIFEIYTKYWDFITEEIDTRRAFNQALLEAFDPGRDMYTVIDSDAVDNIRDQILQTRRQSSRDRAVQEYGDR